MNWYKQLNGSLLGPFSGRECASNEGLSTGNPDAVPWREHGYLPEWREDGPAPLGYAAPVVEDRDGAYVVALYLDGTIDERASATLAQWRETADCSAWAGAQVIAEGGMFDAYQAHVATLSQAAKADWQYRTRWRRNSPQIIAGLDAMRPELSPGDRAYLLDALFRAAQELDAQQR